MNRAENVSSCLFSAPEQQSSQILLLVLMLSSVLPTNSRSDWHGTCWGGHYLVLIALEVTIWTQQCISNPKNIYWNTKICLKP